MILHLHPPLKIERVGGTGTFFNPANSFYVRPGKHRTSLSYNSGSLVSTQRIYKTLEGTAGSALLLCPSVGFGNVRDSFGMGWKVTVFASRRVTAPLEKRAVSVACQMHEYVRQGDNEAMRRALRWGAPPDLTEQETGRSLLDVARGLEKVNPDMVALIREALAAP